MSLRDNELARRQDGKLELRPDPLRVRWSFNDLLTSDGHELRAVFSGSARVLPDPTERRMFEEVVLGSRYAISDEELAAHFEPSLRAAASRAAEKRPAGEWAGGQFKNEFVEALRMAAAPVAFGCGVELLSPFQIDLQSPSYQRQRARSMQQALAEQQTAGQMEHVQRAAELLKQFQSIRESAPDLSPSRVLEQISPTDRGAVFQTLLLASAKQKEADRLWAVAGPYLVRIDLQGGPPRPQLFPLPPGLGPLRSISAADVEGKRVFLIGARSGFMLVDPQNSAEAKLFSDTGVESPLGFNRVVYWGPKHGFAASHGDAGVVLWDPNEPDAPKSTLRPDRFVVSEPMITTESGSTHTAGPRNLEVLDEGSLIFSAGNRLFVTDLLRARSLPTESNAEIVAILRDERQLLIVHEDGTLCGFDPASQTSTCLSRRATRIRAAGALPWLGSTRLLLAPESGPVQCVGFDDPLVTEFQSIHRGLRVVAGSTDLVAAVSPDRQRLLLWHAWDGRQPLTELYLTGLTRHRIADVEFG